jgi:hypothetical protein
MIIIFPCFFPFAITDAILALEFCLLIFLCPQTLTGRAAAEIKMSCPISQVAMHAEFVPILLFLLEIKKSLQ